MRTLNLIGLILLLAVTSGQSAHAQHDAAACPLQPIGSFHAGSVIDGRTFRLQDGRAVRLAAIEVPPLRPTPGGARHNAGAAARAQLEKLLTGRPVVLKSRDPARDRYGQFVAHGFVAEDGSERWIQQELVAAGHARVGVRLGGLACAAPLFATERKARRAQIGLWADPFYAIRKAGDATALLGDQGRFTIAEGRVLSVRHSGGTIYLNFGRLWSGSLTVTISDRHERVFAAAGMQPKNLEGRLLRVRGWVENRNGPRIEADSPEQMEFADQD